MFCDVLVVETQENVVYISRQDGGPPFRSEDLITKHIQCQLAWKLGKHLFYQQTFFTLHLNIIQIHTQLKCDHLDKIDLAYRIYYRLLLYLLPTQ